MNDRLCSHSICSFSIVRSCKNCVPPPCDLVHSQEQEQEQQKHIYAQCLPQPLTMKKKTHAQPLNIIWFLKFVSFFGGFASSEYAIKRNMKSVAIDFPGPWRLHGIRLLNWHIHCSISVISPESIFTLHS